MHFYLKRMGENAYFSFKESNHVGTFVHKVLSDFAISVKRKTLFEEKSNDFIQDSLYRSFKNVSFSSKYKVDFAKAWRYIEMVGAYFHSFAFGKNEEEIRNMFLLSEVSFKISLEDAIIGGKFDLLMKDNKSVRIVDYKTRGSDIEIDGIQIALYKLAVEHIYRLKVIPIIVYIGDEEIKEERLNEAEYCEIIGQIRNIIKNMIDYMNRNKIPEFTRDTETCYHCSLNYNCRKIVEEVFNE